MSDIISGSVFLYNINYKYFQQLCYNMTRTTDREALAFVEM